MLRVRVSFEGERDLGGRAVRGSPRTHPPPHSENKLRITQYYLLCYNANKTQVWENPPSLLSGQSHRSTSTPPAASH